MIEFRHILCPVDFSETSVRALTYASAFATWYQAQLTVLHVTTAFAETAVGAGDAGGAPHAGSRDDIIARIRRSIDQAGAPALNARPLVQEGRAADVIVDCAAALKADLLVMGTHGLGGFHRLVLGSVTERVTRTATRPVLTVPPSAPATNAGPVVFKKILCPFDYSPSALRALRYALELGRQADGCVTVLYAMSTWILKNPASTSTSTSAGIASISSTTLANGCMPSSPGNRGRGARSRRSWR